MAKIGRLTGPSDKTLPTPDVAAVEPAATPAAAADHPEPVALKARGEHSSELPGGNGAFKPAADEEGGEGPSPGSSSETSTEKPPTTPVTSGRASRKRVRTTGSPSAPGPTGGPSAPSMGGAPTGLTSGTDVDETAATDD